MRTAFTVGALLLVVLLAVVIVAGDRRHGPPAISPDPTVEAVSAASGDLAVPPENELARSSAVALDQVGFDASPQTARDRLLAAAEDRIVVLVVEEGSELPITDALVAVDDGRQRGVVLPTDERGELAFRALEVPARLGDPVEVAVLDGSNERLRATFVLQPRITVRVPPKLILRGEVVLTSSASTEGLSISAWMAPPGIGTFEQFLAGQDLADGGRFELALVIERVPTAFTLRVSGDGGVPASVRVRTSELTSPAGARVVVGLARLTLVIDEDGGAPIAAARIRCTATASTDGYSALCADTSTASNGRARMWVPAGPLRVCVGKSSHASAEETIEIGAADVELALTLRRLGEADVLEGSVVFEDGSPVANALVEASSAAGVLDLASVSVHQGGTDAAGRFRIETAIDRPVRVFADAAEGGSIHQVWNPGDAPIRLVIDRGVALSVDARGLTGGPVQRGNHAVVVFVDDGGNQRVTGTDAFPFAVGPLPPGRWRACAIAGGEKRWASAEIVLVRDRANELVLEFAPLEYVEGRVEPVPDPDRRLAVAYELAGWPKLAIEELLTESLGDGGSFRVAAPAPGELVLREGDRTIERRPARGGTPLVFTLPD